MKTVEVNTIGVKAKLQEPETAEEYDKLAGQVGACLSAAVKYYRYHVQLSDFRDIFLHGDQEAGLEGLEGVTKLARKTKVTGKTKDGKETKEYDEKEEAYANRVYASKGGADQFQALADKVSALVPFDPKRKEPKPKKPVKLDEDFKATASAILKGPHVKKFMADVLKEIGLTLTITGDAEKDNYNFGWAVKKLQTQREQARRKADLAKMVGA